MKQLHALFQRHGTKLWLLTLVVAGLLIFNAGAAQRAIRVRWEYKTIWFRVDTGDNMNDVQKTFTDALNREARYGWEFVGRCGHVNAVSWWTDFVVFRRPTI